MVSEFNIDYLVYNTPKINPAVFALGELQPSGGNYKYKRVCMRSGAIIQHGNKKTDLFHVILGGTAISKLDIPVSTLIESEIEGGSTFSRIDLCCTQYIDEQGLILPSEIMELYRQNRIVSTWSNYGCKALVNASIPSEHRVLDLPEHAETVYVGSWDRRAKHGIFRGYDKGVQLNIEPYLITRFECEIKRQSAQSVVKSLVAGDSIQACFRAKFDVLEHSQWDDMFSSMPPSDLMTGKAKSDIVTDEDIKIAKRWAWLIEQVAPSLGRAMAHDAHYTGTHENYHLFMGEVKKHYDEAIRKFAELDKI